MGCRFMHVPTFLRCVIRVGFSTKIFLENQVLCKVGSWKSDGAKVQMCTGRPGWMTMSFRQPKYKATMRQIDINLVDILQVDDKREEVWVEPLVTMGQITATLLPLGWTLPVVPELDDLTVGGLVMGTGVETSSHHFGLFQHICQSMEIILPDGSLVTCSKDENADLFQSAFWSHGTLGFLASARLKIIPAKSHVRITYMPFNTIKEAACKLDEEVRKKDNDFAEGIVFNQDQSVVMTGVLTDQVDGSKLNSIGRWYKPWFYEHVNHLLKKNREVVEYIPLREYYHRHTRSLFWELRDIIPFGNHPLFRLCLGWAMPPKVSLLKRCQPAAVKRLYERNHVIQDMLVPLADLQGALQVFHKAVQLQLLHHEKQVRCRELIAGRQPVPRATRYVQNDLHIENSKAMFEAYYVGLNMNELGASLQLDQEILRYADHIQHLIG